MNYECFICHSSLDKPFVRKLEAELERFGCSCWVDENEIGIGESLRERIEHGLENSKFFLIVLSKSSI